MGVIFVDGFDHYATADFGQKWEVFDRANITTTNARTGLNALYLDGNQYYPAYAKKYFPSTKGPTLVVGFFMKITQYTKGNLYYTFNDGGTTQIKVLINLSSYTISIYRGATLLGTSALPLTALNEEFYFEIKVVLNNTTGSVSIRKNGADFYSVSGVDTMESTNAYATSFTMYHDPEGNGGYLRVYYDDLYIADDDFKGDCKVITLMPTGAGATSQFTPSAGANYECVDDATPDGGSTYVGSNTLNHVDTYVFDNVSIAGTVHAVQAVASASKVDAGARQIALVARPASTDRPGASQDLSEGYYMATEVWDLNPEDSAAWEVADINNAEFGIKVAV